MNDKYNRGLSMGFLADAMRVEQKGSGKERSGFTQTFPI